MNKKEEKLAKRIGLNISKFRRDAGLTSEQLAYENDISKGYLSNIENGNRLPSLTMLLRISVALRCELRDLV